VGLCLPDTVAHVLTLALGIVVLALAWRRRSPALAIAAAFVLSPIVWRHYFVVLLVPLALAYPRLHPAWAIPLGFWFVSGTYNGGTWQVAVALGVACATIVAAERRVSTHARSVRRLTEPAPAR
jgi:hypothetical protein